MSKGTWIFSSTKIPIIKKWFGWLYIELNNIYIDYLDPAYIEEVLDSIDEDVRRLEDELVALAASKGHPVKTLLRTISWEDYVAKKVRDNVELLMVHAERKAMINLVKRADPEDINYYND